MNDILRIARLRIALQRAFLGRAILRVIDSDDFDNDDQPAPLKRVSMYEEDNGDGSGFDLPRGGHVHVQVQAVLRLVAGEGIFSSMQ